MPIHVTTRDKRDVVTFLSDVDVDFVSLVDHGANWTPFTSIKHDATGVSLMPGQIIQAIIMPLEVDIIELERLYGEEWFGQVDIAKKEEFEATVRYVQRDDADFEEFEREAAFVLKDIADTGGHFVVGTLKADKRNEPALEIPLRLLTNGDESVDSNSRPNADKGENCMTVDEITKLVAESTAAAEARMWENVEKRLAELDRQPKPDKAGQWLDGTNSDDADTTHGAGKSDSQGTFAGIVQRLDELSAQLKQVAEKQDALEHAAVGRRSTPEDSVVSGGMASPFKGMFAGL